MDQIIVVERQLRYVKNVLLERKENFQESFENSLFEGENTAAEVFIHGLTPLYKYSMNLLHPEITEKTLELNLNRDLPPPNQYIDLYERVLNVLRDINEQMSEEELKEHIVFPFNPETTISRVEWIGLNIMHTVTHIGQALRLQSLYVRHKMK